ncbi:unnamed protein product [Ilex paraguariensis]|uniref:Uncharacterized protein n=1 Tax=Ilex paraguariensis TaxID=185542 RepID=A0ABC8SFU4_9AQUA
MYGTRKAIHVELDDKIEAISELARIFRNPTIELELSASISMPNAKCQLYASKYILSGSDMWFYVSEHENFNDFSSEGALVWHETNIPYGVWGLESTRSLSLKYHPSEALKHNGSLYAHVFFARSGYPPDPSDPEYQPSASFGRTHSIVAYLPKSKADKRKSLLGDSKGSAESATLSEVGFVVLYVFGTSSDVRWLMTLELTLKMMVLWNGFHIGSPMLQSIWLMILQVLSALAIGPTTTSKLHHRE